MSDSGYLIDTSVWTALAFATHSHHAVAVETFAHCSFSRPAVFCRATQQSFLRIATTPAILRLYGAASFTNRDAWVVLTRFMEIPTVAYHEEPSGILPVWRDLAVRNSPSPKVWMDAYLAAFAILAGIQLVTLDKGFKQYEGLDLHLISQP